MRHILIARACRAESPDRCIPTFVIGLLVAHSKMSSCCKPDSPERCCSAASVSLSHNARLRLCRAGSPDRFYSPAIDASLILTYLRLKKLNNTAEPLSSALPQACAHDEQASQHAAVRNAKSQPPGPAGKLCRMGGLPPYVPEQSVRFMHTATKRPWPQTLVPKMPRGWSDG